jgi:hypothetical protein
MAEPYNLSWDEGSDLSVAITYMSGPTGAEAIVDLTAYKLRMDISGPDGKVLSVLNDELITDTDLFTAGSQTDSTYEVTMNAVGEISITLSRNLNLPGGPFYRYTAANPSVTSFDYDIFLRDSSNRQKKIVYGVINVVKSVTKWQ